jgi:hypothetical protein
MRPMNRSSLSPIVYYSIIAWTIVCFVGTWSVILGYGILQNGFIPTVVTFCFALVIWAVPFAGMVLFYLYVTPVGKASSEDLSSTV